MKYLIVGLGNPDKEYLETRHNVGFKVLDAFAKKHATDGVFPLKRLANVKEVKYKGRTLVLVQPTTYMNRSGKALNYWMQEEKVPLENVLVITDDIALPFGKLRMKAKGSDGGHNGLRDIFSVLKTTDYARLRFGIGSEFHPGQQSDYVLGQWSEEEQAALPERLDQAVKFIEGFVTIGLQRTMSELNGK